RPAAGTPGAATAGAPGQLGHCRPESRAAPDSRASIRSRREGPPGPQSLRAACGRALELRNGIPAFAGMTNKPCASVGTRLSNPDAVAPGTPRDVFAVIPAKAGIPFHDVGVRLHWGIGFPLSRE